MLFFSLKGDFLLLIYYSNDEEGVVKADNAQSRYIQREVKRSFAKMKNISQI